VNVTPLDDQSRADLTEPLSLYRDELAASGQEGAAANVAKLPENLDAHFVRITPVTMQAEQSSR
jgi:glutamate synthase (NADPH) large chain